MTLSAGTKLSHYEITSQLGKGGMGEVYQAKDTKLGRDVAIKVLPDEFALDPDRVARFQREAKLLASLNHPNIAAIYGLEDSNGTHFLVMELIEGDTLSNRIKRGPVPVEEALKIAIQITEALEAAHEKGVIHRDLKPANIKITPEGKVKVLDFGLAKAFAGETDAAVLSDSPTLSDAATRQGVILGTAAYMSPEQATGKSVDKRADIWAFGVVLFEMLTGKKLFEGETVTETLAGVIKGEPEWGSLPPELHPRIRFMLERCLKKVPKNRTSGISDARVDIQEVLSNPDEAYFRQLPGMESRTRQRSHIVWAALTAILIAVAGVIVWYLKPTLPPEPKRVMRFEYELPEGRQIRQDTIIGNRLISLAISPDGSRFVYGAAGGLYVRSLDSPDARLIAGTDKDSRNPFFSPDGQWIGYLSASEKKLKKVAIGGGAPVILCDAGTLNVEGASWSSDDTIVYSDFPIGIMRVSANGGTPETLVKANPADINKEGMHRYPQMLPDGKNVLFTSVFFENAANNQIVVQSLESGERKVLVKGADSAWYLSTGHIVYTLPDNNTANLFAVPFDPNKLEIRGGSVSILQGIRAPAFSDSGTLVYVPQPATVAGAAGAASSGQTLVWVNRQGKEDLVDEQPKEYGPLKISPDGTRAAVTVTTAGNPDIWIRDLARKTMTRLTFTEGTDNHPVWTPDGRRIVYNSGGEGGRYGIYTKAADGTGEVEKLVSIPGRVLQPFSLSRDGMALALTERTLSPPGFDIGMMSMEADHERKTLLQEKHNEGCPRISPDGHWLAYQSDESGSYEVYVRPFPEVNSGGRWQVSTNGGDSPLWSPDGRELFYRSGDSFMAVGVETEPAFKPGNPELLFKGAYYANPGFLKFTFWDIHPDGQRFLMLKPAVAADGKSAAEGLRKINIVLNWFEELKERVPVD